MPRHLFGPYMPPYIPLFPMMLGPHLESLEDAMVLLPLGVRDGERVLLVMESKAVSIIYRSRAAISNTIGSIR